MSPIDNYQSLLLTFGVAILVGFVAGAIPAVRATSYSPAVALKGNFGLSPSGKIIRTAVVGLQFFISAVLIIGACYMQLQRQYLTRSADYGFAKDELVVCDTNYPAQLPDHNTVSEAVRKLPFVSSVTFSWSTLGEDSNTQGWIFKDVNGDPIDPRTLFGETDYLKTMGIRLIEGRDFAPTDSAAIIVNQHTRDKYPETVGVGKYMSFGDTQYEIVGICENAKFSTLSKATEPILIIKMPGYPCNILNVRVEKGANMFASMKEIQKTLNQFDPGYPFETQLYDQIFRCHLSERKQIVHANHDILGIGNIYQHHWRIRPRHVRQRIPQTRNCHTESVWSHDKRNPENVQSAIFDNSACKLHRGSSCRMAHHWQMVGKLRLQN